MYELGIKHCCVNSLYVRRGLPSKINQKTTTLSQSFSVLTSVMAQTAKGRRTLSPSANSFHFAYEPSVCYKPLPLQ